MSLPGATADEITAQPAAWVATATLAGLLLALAATAQLVTAVAQGLSLSTRDTQGVANTLATRLGFAFGTVGPSVLVLFLLLAVLLVSAPRLAGRRTTGRQERQASVTLALASVVPPVVAVGSILTVLYNLRTYTVNRQSAPAYFRLQLGGFLLGVLVPAVVTFAAALAARAAVPSRRGPGRRAPTEPGRA